MLGKNNFKEKLRRMENQDKHDRFSIRKLTIGAASVLIGFAFMGFNAHSVRASEDKTDTTTPTSVVETEQKEKSQADSQEQAKTDKNNQTAKNDAKSGKQVKDNQLETKETKAKDNSNAQDSADKSNQQSGQDTTGSAKNNKDLTNGTEQSQNSEKTTGSTGSQTDASGKTSDTSKTSDSKKAGSTDKSATTPALKAKKVEGAEKSGSTKSLADVQKEYQDLEKNIASMTDAEKTAAAEQLQKDIQGLSLADQAKIGVGIQNLSYVAGQARQTVDNLSDFIAAMEDENTTDITLDNDITVDQTVYLSHSLTIHGNGHSLSTNGYAHIVSSGGSPTVTIDGVTFAKWIFSGMNKIIFEGTNHINGFNTSYTDAVAATEVDLNNNATLDITGLTGVQEYGALEAQTLNLGQGSKLTISDDTTFRDVIQITKQLNIAKNASFVVQGKNMSRGLTLGVLHGTDGTVNADIYGNLVINTSSDPFFADENTDVKVENGANLSVNTSNELMDNGATRPSLTLECGNGSTTTIKCTNVTYGDASLLKLKVDNPRLFDISTSVLNNSITTTNSTFKGTNCGMLLRTYDRAGAWTLSSINGALSTGVVSSGTDGQKFDTPYEAVGDIPSKGYADKNSELSPSNWYTQMASQTAFSEIKMGSDVSNFAVDSDANRFDSTTNATPITIHTYDSSIQLDPTNWTKTHLSITDSGKNNSPVTTSTTWSNTTDKIINNVKWSAGNLIDKNGHVVGTITADGKITLNDLGKKGFTGRSTDSLSTTGNASADNVGGTAKLLVSYEDGTTDTVPVEIDGESLADQYSTDTVAVKVHGMDTGAWGSSSTDNQNLDVPDKNSITFTSSTSTTPISGASIVDHTAWVDNEGNLTNPQLQVTFTDGSTHTYKASDSKLTVTVVNAVSKTNSVASPLTPSNSDFDRPNVVQDSTTGKDTDAEAENLVGNATANYPSTASNNLSSLSEVKETYTFVDASGNAITDFTGSAITGDADHKLVSANVKVSYWKQEGTGTSATWVSDGYQILSGINFKVRNTDAETDTPSVKPGKNVDPSNHTSFYGDGSNIVTHIGGNLPAAGDLIHVTKGSGSSVQEVPATSTNSDGSTVTNWSAQWVNSDDPSSATATDAPSTSTATTGDGETGYIEVTYGDSTKEIIAVHVKVVEGKAGDAINQAVTATTPTAEGHISNAKDSGTGSSAVKGLDTMFGLTSGSYKWYTSTGTGASETHGSEISDPSSYFQDVSNSGKDVYVQINWGDGTEDQYVKIPVTLTSEASTHTSGTVTPGEHPTVPTTPDGEQFYVASGNNIYVHVNGTVPDLSNVIVVKSNDRSHMVMPTSDYMITGWNAVDTTSAGSHDEKLTITYNDNSTAKLTLHVHVIGGEPGIGINQSVSGSTPAANEHVSNTSELNRDFSTSTHPVSYTWYTKTGATYTAMTTDQAKAYFKDVTHNHATNLYVGIDWGDGTNKQFVNVPVNLTKVATDTYVAENPDETITFYNPEDHDRIIATVPDAFDPNAGNLTPSQVKDILDHLAPRGYAVEPGYLAKAANTLDGIDLRVPAVQRRLVFKVRNKNGQTRTVKAVVGVLPYKTGERISAQEMRALIKMYLPKGYHVSDRSILNGMTVTGDRDLVIDVAKNGQRRTFFFIGRHGKVLKHVRLTVDPKQLTNSYIKHVAKPYTPKGYKLMGKTKLVSDHVDIWLTNSKPISKAAPRAKRQLVLFVKKNGTVVKHAWVNTSDGQIKSANAAAKKHLPKGYRMTGIDRIKKHYDVWLNK